MLWVQKLRRRIREEMWETKLQLDSSRTSTKAFHVCSRKTGPSYSHGHRELESSVGLASRGSKQGSPETTASLRRSPPGCHPNALASPRSVQIPTKSHGLSPSLIDRLLSPPSTHQHGLQHAVYVFLFSMPGPCSLVIGSPPGPTDADYLRGSPSTSDRCGAITDLNDDL
jgi:hypothetical protein